MLLGGPGREHLNLQKGIGSTRAGVIKTTFKEETESDWFGEQVDLCGGVDRLIRNAFEVLVENGYQPEIAYFECLHELKLIVDLIQRYGISGMYRGVSETARYGGLTVGGNVINQETKERMRNALRDIQSGAFAERWVSAYRNEKRRAFEKYLDELDAHPIEQVGKRLREMMWPADASTCGKKCELVEAANWRIRKGREKTGNEKSQKICWNKGQEEEKIAPSECGKIDRVEELLHFQTKVCKESGDTGRNSARTHFRSFVFCGRKNFHRKSP